MGPVGYTECLLSDLLLLCLLGWYRTTRSSRNPRQRGTEGKEVSPSFSFVWFPIQCGKKKRKPILKCTTLYKNIWEKWVKPFANVIYLFPNCSNYMPQVFWEETFSLFHTMTKWLSVLAEFIFFLGKQRRAGLPWDTWGERWWGKRLFSDNIVLLILFIWLNRRQTSIFLELMFNAKVNKNKEVRLFKY